MHNSQNFVFKTLPFRRTWCIDALLLTAWLCISRGILGYAMRNQITVCLRLTCGLACMALVRRKFIDQSVTTLTFSDVPNGSSQLRGGL